MPTACLVLVSFLLLLFSPPAAAQGTATLGGQITNLRPGRGTCLLALFNTAAAFPRRTAQAVRTLRLPASGGSTAVFSFPSLPPGPYALAVFQDENDNGRLDTNFLGFPTERFGFSNNARRMMFFPPAFEAARVLLPATGAAIVVRVH